MHSLQEFEALPTVGSLIGRHLLVRELAVGPVGPLYLARSQRVVEGQVNAVDTLVRVVPLPADLPAKEAKAIADAIWGTAHVGHGLVLPVIDVIAKMGFVTLVHDYRKGALLASMHAQAQERGSGFPWSVAVRIVLDVIEGLEQSRAICGANRVLWHAGSTAIGSLYLCGDGRTRALDGQVVSATLRSAHMRMLCGTASSVAPEMLNGDIEPDERTDVFAVGAVLWELFTGRVFVVKSPETSAIAWQSIAQSLQLPKRLVDTLERALELDPRERQPSLRELAVEIARGAEKVATYQQVIEFASALVPFELASQPEPPVPPPVVAQSVESAPGSHAVRARSEQLSSTDGEALPIAVALIDAGVAIAAKAKNHSGTAKSGAAAKQVTSGDDNAIGDSKYQADLKAYVPSDL